MKKTWALQLVFCQLIAAAAAAGTNYFVRPPATCTNTMAQAPFTNWAMAATNIQWVIALARDDDTITVSNGTYALNVTITNKYAMTIQSSDPSAPENTVFDGLSANRHGLIITNAGAVMCGFTIKNVGVGAGYYGVRLYAGLLNDCVITGCYYGGEICGANTVLSNCTVTRSTAYGLRVATNTLIINSRFVGNGGQGLYIYGGADPAVTYSADIYILNCAVISNRYSGIYINAAKVYLRDCDILCNTSPISGGGLICYSSGAVVEMDRCRIIGNAAGVHGGGIYASLNTNNIIRNCLIAYNSTTNTAGRGGGIGWHSCGAQIESCTVVSNYSAGVGVYAGGIAGWSATGGRIVNSIVYYNENASGTMNWNAEATNCPNANVCTTPTIPNGVNIITNEPAFVDWGAGEFQLRAESPCINTGTNIMTWMAGALDVDRHSRIDRIYGIVDMGCYEYIPRGMFFYVR